MDTPSALTRSPRKMVKTGMSTPVQAAAMRPTTSVARSSADAYLRGAGRRGACARGIGGAGKKKGRARELLGGRKRGAGCRLPT